MLPLSGSGQHNSLIVPGTHLACWSMKIWRSQRKRFSELGKKTYCLFITYSIKTSNYRYMTISFNLMPRRLNLRCFHLRRLIQRILEPDFICVLKTAATALQFSHVSLSLQFCVHWFWQVGTGACVLVTADTGLRWPRWMGFLIWRIFATCLTPSRSCHHRSLPLTMSPMKPLSGLLSMTLHGRRIGNVWNVNRQTGSQWVQVGSAKNAARRNFTVHGSHHDVWQILELGCTCHMGMKQLHHLHRLQSLPEEGIDDDDILVVASLRTWKAVSKPRKKFWHMIHRLSLALQHHSEITFLKVIVPKEVLQPDIILQLKEVLMHVGVVLEPHQLEGHHWPFCGKGSARDPLVTALRQLKKDDDTDWNSRKGPEPGIRWRTGQHPQPPSWKYDQNDLRAYAKYEKKVRIWEIQMQPYASKSDQALLLYGSLTGDAEQELWASSYRWGAPAKRDSGDFG